MKELIEFILLSVILTFVWNSVRRLLFAPKQKPQYEQHRDTPQQRQKQNSKNSHGLNWDAQEAEYEEIKDENKNENYGSK